MLGEGGEGCFCQMKPHMTHMHWRHLKVRGSSIESKGRLVCDEAGLVWRMRGSWKSNNGRTWGWEARVLPNCEGLCVKYQWT